MTYGHIIENILGAKSKVKILSFLVRNNGSFSANQISKKISMTPRTILLAIEDLITLNIVNVEKKEKDKIYSINEKNWFVENVLNYLFRAEKSFNFEVKQWIIKNMENYLIDIYSILLKKDKVLIIFKDYVNALWIGEVKKFIEDNLKEDLKRIFSIELDFDFSFLINICDKEDISDCETIFGMTPEQLKTKSMFEKERIKRAKEFFGV